jgi:hypothetical protein
MDQENERENLSTLIREIMKGLAPLIQGKIWIVEHPRRNFRFLATGRSRNRGLRLRKSRSPETPWDLSLGHRRKVTW